MSNGKSISDADFNFKEKRKWQIALRRYILEKNKSSQYAPYFGLDIENFRKWIEIQFNDELNWENFSTKWQFDHIVPVAYFNLKNEEDLKLCWNFINIRVENIFHNKNRGHRVDVYETKRYFEKLYQKTLFPLCLAMVDKITQLNISEITATSVQEEFLITQKDHLQKLSGFGAYEFNQLNAGEAVNDILEQQKQLKQFENLT
ncbi:MAG: hypothetical protein IPP48_09555 [Chitinophagaceae bacterium]|nr:hypothetical protein [Chitinophagaceae bacterium]